MTRLISFLAAAVTVLGLTAAPSAEAGVRLYGNWCGPGSDVNGLPPVDPLDAACMRHDLCYISTGSVSCRCDVTLMRELRAISYPNPAVRDAARAMYDALAMTPCDDPAGWALKQSMMWSDVAADALTGRATPLEVPRRWMDLFSRGTVD